MNTAVVSDLCTAFGELIEQDPKVAATVAKKLGAVLLEHAEHEETRTQEYAEAEKLQQGRFHEQRQRELDIRERELDVEAERVKVAAVEASARR